MTQRRKQKRRIRARMARTGERYSTARAALLDRANTTIVGSPLVMVPVREMSKAIAFYRDGLGFSLRARSVDDAWAEISSDATGAALHLGGRTGTDTGLGLLVADLAATCENVALHGGRIAEGDPAVDTVVTIADPDNNFLRLMSSRNGSH